ncbi:MAG: type II secretion system F family protein, partial [Syntrophobacteraceae bacterium]
YLEKKAALRSKTLISMMYPAVVLVVALVVVIFLVLFVIPKFAILLRGRRLPANTQFLIDTADFLKAHGMEIILFFAGGIGLIVLLMSTPQVRLFLDRYRMRIPIIGPISRLATIVQFARTFGALLESRIPLVEALRATSATIGNSAVNQLLETMVNRVLAGEPLSAALEGDTAFTPMVRAMMKIGEHSGLMDDAMGTVAELHEQMLEDKIARMSAMIEPVLIVVLGGIVGFVAWGLIAGMLAMYSGSR